MKKELTWREHIDRCLKMGVSKKAYCAEHDLSYQLFFYHQRKLQEKESSSDFQEIVLEQTGVNFHPDVLQVQFANGHVLLFSEHLLDRVFKLCQSSSS